MKIRVAVIFGGKSTEHEISCISANQVINALDKEKYDVLPIYISKNGEFYTGNELFDLSNYSDFIKNPESKLIKVSIYKDGNDVKVSTIKGFRRSTDVIDVAFPVVHGTNVEDGSLAGFLNMLDIPYTSCDVLGGAIGQDKAVMKDIFKANDIPMTSYFVVYGDNFEDKYSKYLASAKKIGFPLIAKPASLGSSIGIEIIKNQSEFKEKVKECLKYDFKVVVEQTVKNLKEVNISVMGTSEEAKLSAIEEVTNGFLDYDKKYQGGNKGTKKIAGGASKNAASKGMASTARRVPAKITRTQSKQIGEIALKAFKVLNAHGCVRIDFMINNKTGKVYCNEINTIPGSLAFYLWKYEGIDFTKECDILIKNAISRYAKRSKKVFSFDTNILDNYRNK